MDQKRLEAVAISVRHWAEAVACEARLRDDLTGLCAIASAELFDQLETIGLRPELHLWTCVQDGISSHVFVVLDDVVVDITATQFSKMRAPKVYIAHKRIAERWEWYQSQEVFDTVRDLIRYQKKHRWPSNQIALSLK